VKLSKAARDVLGDLIDNAGETVGAVIRARGGNASNVREVGHWAYRSLGEAAEMAAAGDPLAAKAVKIAKQAGRLGRKFGRDSS